MQDANDDIRKRYCKDFWLRPGRTGQGFYSPAIEDIFLLGGKPFLFSRKGIVGPNVRKQDIDRRGIGG